MPDDTMPNAASPAAAQSVTTTVAPTLPAASGAAMIDDGAAATRLFIGWLAAWSDLATIPHDLAQEVLDYPRRSRLLAMTPPGGRDFADPLALYGRSVEAAFADLSDLRNRLVERMAECGRRLDRRWQQETAQAADALIEARHGAQAISEAPPPPA